MGFSGKATFSLKTTHWALTSVPVFLSLLPVDKRFSFYTITSFKARQFFYI